MVSKQKTVAKALILAALVSLVACAGNTSAGGAPAASSSPRHSSATTRLLPTATYTGPIRTPATIAAADVTLDVPATQPTIPWQQAFATCSSGDAVCDPNTAAVISLATATSPNAGAISSNDPSIVPLMKRTLVYVITQVGVPCAPSGPPAGPGAQPTPVRAYSCTFVNFVDAANGKVLYSTNGPTSSG